MSIKVQTTLTSAVYKKVTWITMFPFFKFTILDFVIVEFRSAHEDRWRDSQFDVDRRRKTSKHHTTNPSVLELSISGSSDYSKERNELSFQMIFALVYLFVTLGYSALPGIFIMIIFIPLNIFSSVIVKKWQVWELMEEVERKANDYVQMKQMKLKDERIKMVNEVLNGIKVKKRLSKKKYIYI